MNNLSAIIITYNEEKNIERCLNSIKLLADEIIIVDCGSTDKTKEISQRYTSGIYYRKWDNNFADQKNFAISKTSCDWILSIDADEEVSFDLIQEIKEFLALNNKKKYFGMYLPRKNIIFGKWLKNGVCWPDYQLKLFRKGSYFQRAVHETVMTDGPCGFLKQPVIHHHYDNIKQFIQKAKKYTDIEVKVLINNNERSVFWKVFAYPIAKFIKVYIFKKGFLDSWSGFVYACLLTYYSFLKRYKYYKYLHRKNNQNIF